jgi:hypothetical protein
MRCRVWSNSRSSRAATERAERHYLGDVADYEVEVGAATLLVSVANPVAEGLFREGDRVAIALPADPVSVVPAS